MNEKKIILIADDEFTSREMLKNILGNGYSYQEAADGQETIDMLSEFGTGISLVLLDMRMPLKDGYAVLEYMNSFDYIAVIPVIMITGESSYENEIRAFELGVSDFIPKPFNSTIVLKRVQNILDLSDRDRNLQNLIEEQTSELYLQTQIVKEQAETAADNDRILIEGLSSVVEFRSLESGSHIHRIKTLTDALYRNIQSSHPELDIKDDEIKRTANASVLHDIGKIAIPDDILLKPGRLTAEEFETMKTHSRAGAQILDRFSNFSDRRFMEYAREICLHHHEKIDGRGYPDHLSGDEIPLYVQIVSVADIYDALVSPRVYKSSFTPAKALEMILNGECGAFSDLIKSSLQDSAAVMESFYHENAAADTHTSD